MLSTDFKTGQERRGRVTELILSIYWIDLNCIGWKEHSSSWLLFTSRCSVLEFYSSYKFSLLYSFGVIETVLYLLIYFKKWYQSAQKIQGKRAQQFWLVNFYVLLVWRNELSIIIFEVQSIGQLLLQTLWILHGQNTVSIQFHSETKRTHIRN